MPYELKRGQIWKVPRGYLHIFAMGKRFVHYRILKTLQQRAAAGKMASVEDLKRYLRRLNATLIRPSSERGGTDKPKTGV